jgi:hypothetical protein
VSELTFEQRLQAAAEAAVAQLTADLAPEEAALALALVLRRSATQLHTLSRQRAAAMRGEPTWPSWAALQNAARSALLQASTCRDLAAKLPPPSA